LNVFEPFYSAMRYFRTTIFLAFIVSNPVAGQDITFDVSHLPSANYSQGYSYIDRWDAVGFNVNVDFRLDSTGEVTFRTSLIVAEMIEGIPSSIAFPVGGSETDIFIYPLLGCSENDFDIDFSQPIKDETFFWGDDLKDIAFLIDDLATGYYFVSYASCHYYGSYVLQVLRPIAGIPPR